MDEDEAVKAINEVASELRALTAQVKTLTDTLEQHADGIAAEAASSTELTHELLKQLVKELSFIADRS